MLKRVGEGVSRASKLCNFQTVFKPLLEFTLNFKTCFPQRCLALESLLYDLWHLCVEVVGVRGWFVVVVFTPHVQKWGEKSKLEGISGARVPNPLVWAGICFLKSTVLSRTQQSCHQQCFVVFHFILCLRLDRASIS